MHTPNTAPQPCAHPRRREPRLPAGPRSTSTATTKVPSACTHPANRPKDDRLPYMHTPKTAPQPCAHPRRRKPRLPAGPRNTRPKGVCVCVLLCVLDFRMGKARSRIWICRSLTALVIVSVRGRHAPLCAFAFGGPQAQKPLLCLNTDFALYFPRKSFATLPDWPRQDKSFDPFGASGRKHILPVRKNFFHCKKWGGRIFPP